MPFSIEPTELPEAVVVVPKVFPDGRGFFQEVFRDDQFAALGLPSRFVQLNHSGSVKGVVRGLHFQIDPPMGKLMRVTRGEAFLVAVDIRKNSPTLGRWVSISASEKNRKQLWAPATFARGFCVVSDFAEIQYLCTATYDPAGEAGIRWNDPRIGVRWPVEKPILSDRDSRAPLLDEWLKRPEAF
jgi:dTDP-4-dehydrorhamnose 3,5-epimerase